MHKTRKLLGKENMDRLICEAVTETNKTLLQKSVEKIIQKNKKVFDNLAKS